MYEINSNMNEINSNKLDLLSFYGSHGNYEVRRYLLESNSMLLVVKQWVRNNLFFEYEGWDGLISSQSSRPT